MLTPGRATMSSQSCSLLSLVLWRGAGMLCLALGGCCGALWVPGSWHTLRPSDRPREAPRTPFPGQQLHAGFCAGRGIWEPVRCRRDRYSSQPCPFLLSLRRDLRGSADVKVLTAIRRGCEGAPASSAPVPRVPQAALKAGVRRGGAAGSSRLFTGEEQSLTAP